MTLPTLTPTQEFLLSLEMERFNVAYRKPAEVQKELVEVVRIVTKPCKKRHVTEAHDQMMFHAGRFAAGATDANAIQAHEQLEKYLEEK